MSLPGPLLFDLQEDIGETTNVAHRYPDVVRWLKALADGAREDLGDAVTGRKGSNVRPVGRLRGPPTWSVDSTNSLLSDPSDSPLDGK